MKILKFLMIMGLCFGIGFGGGHTEIPVRREELKRTKGIFYWFLLGRYTIGTVMLALGMLLTLHDQPYLEEVLYKYFAGAVPIGLGVALKFLLDSDKLQALEIAS